MKLLRVHAANLLMPLFLLACAPPLPGLFPPGPGEASASIYLVSHGWHAGIVVKRDDIPEGIWPQHQDFPDSEYLEVGWGDKDYYMTPEPGLWITFKAGFLPSASVLHIVGFNGPVTSYFPHSEVIRIDLSRAGFKNLCQFLEDSYARGETALSQPLGPSPYANGQFFLARESYHIFNTCNAWTARALREAGLPIRPAANLRIMTLMTNAAKFGSVLQTRPGASALQATDFFVYSPMRCDATANACPVRFQP